jgi:hypothetical protein
MIFKKIYHLGDKLEDKVRGKLSHYPIIYAFVGGAGIIIFWRGIWHSIDFLVQFYNRGYLIAELNNYFWWDGPLSVLIGGTLLLMVGLFVSSFIGNEIIISGLKGEKKMVEKAEQEIEEEIIIDTAIESELHEISRRLEKIQKIIENNKKNGEKNI